MCGVKRNRGGKLQSVNDTFITLQKTNHSHCFWDFCNQKECWNYFYFNINSITVRKNIYSIYENIVSLLLRKYYFDSRYKQDSFEVILYFLVTLHLSKRVYRNYWNSNYRISIFKGYHAFMSKLDIHCINRIKTWNGEVRWAVSHTQKLQANTLYM